MTVVLLVAVVVGLGVAEPASAAAPTVSDPVLVAQPSAPLSLAVATDDDGDQLVVYSAMNGPDSQILAALVSSNGFVHDVELISRDGDQGDENPSVAFNGSFFFVTWTHPFSSTDHDILGRVVLTDGTVADTVASIQTSTDDQMDSSVATNGSSFVVTYADRRNGTFDVYSQNISKTGKPVGSVWQDGRTTGRGQGIYGARIGASGAVKANGIVVSAAPGAESEPDVAWNGAYLVAWTDERSGRGDADIYAARVSASGTVQEPDGYAIAATTGTEVDPAVARAHGSSRWAVADLNYGFDRGVEMRTTPTGAK